MEDGLSDDALFHQLRDYVIVAGVGFAEQQLLVRILSRKGERGERIHNQINPKHLNRFQDFLLQQCGPNKRAGDGHDVDCELELKKLSNGVVNVASPKHCLDDRVKIVVDEDYCCGLARHLGPCDPHRESHVGLLQSGSVVGSVSRNCDNVPPFLEPSHEAIFVLGP